MNGEMADSTIPAASRESRHHHHPDDAMDGESQTGLGSPSSSSSSSSSSQPHHQYLHPPLQVSFDSIPKNANDLANISTPPIQQQESILNALAQTVAQEDQDSLEDTHTDCEGSSSSSSSSSSVGSEDEASQRASQSTRRRRRTLPSATQTTTASSSTFQDKGNGWALLTQPRSSASSSSSTLPSSSTERKRKRTRATTLSNSTGEMLALPSNHNKHPHQRPNPIRTSSPAISSPAASRPSTPLNANILLSGGPVDCDTPSRKSKDASDSFSSTADVSSSSLAASDARARASISGPSNKELPAEGSGLRGKDENKMVVDQEHDEHRQRTENTKPQSASPFDGATATRAPPLSETPSASTASSSSNGAASAAPTAEHNSAAASSSSNPLNPPPARKLCIRHQRMADEGTVGKLQRSIESLPLADQTAVNSVWSIFSSSSHARRALILQGILSMCCFSQLSLLSSELALAIRIDPFSLFPREVSLKVLSHLDAMSLGRAAQVSRSWRALADDDLLWRNMCEQHIERKCDKCGWGLPLLSEKRRRIKGPAPVAGSPQSRQLTYAKNGGATSLDGVNAIPLAKSPNLPASNLRGPESLSLPSAGPSASPPSSSGNLKRTITAAANAAAIERHSRAGTTNNSRAPSPSHSTSHGQSHEHKEEAEPARKRQRGETSVDGVVTNNSNALTTTAAAPSAPATRPWKSVYCERLAIERNWRRGRYTVRSLKGHTDGIMCLQFNESLSHPSFPVLITGSYDRTARIWNMDTGEELRVLRGHTRGVRCLQFDEAKLITGSMDRTLKIWNWRTGDLVRTLEGHTEGIVCLHFNDHLLASGSADSNIKIWNFKTGQCHTLRGHTDWVNAVTLWSGKGQVPVSSTSDGAENTFLFSASDDGHIRLWDLAYNECLMVYTGHVGQCQGLSLVHMPEEVVETLANGGNIGPNGGNGNSNGARRNTRPNTAAVDPLEDSSYFTPRDGAASGPAASTSANNGSSSSTTAATGSSCGFNPSSVPGGRNANTGSAPAIPEHFYNAPASGQHRTSLDRLNRSQRNKIEPRLLKLQERLQAAGLVDPLPLDAEMGDLEWGSRRGSGSAASHAPDTASANAGPAASHDSGAGPSAPSNTTPSAAHARLRPMLFSCSLDNTIKIWDVRTGVCIRTLFGHMAGLWALSTDRLRLATASHDSTLKVWELATGKHLFSICEHRGPVTCVQIGDDKVVSGSDDHAVNIYSFTG